MGNNRKENNNMRKQTWKAAVSAAAICVAAALPSWAVITNPVAANYTLTDDETVDAALTVNSGVTVDLAGHKLTVKGLGTGTGTITSSVAGGVLEINVDSGVTVDNTAVALTGGTNLQVWKTGAGTLNMTKENTGFGGSGVVSLVVKAGVVKKNPNNTKRACCGARYSKLVVENGGQIEIGGQGYYDYDYEIAGSGPDGKGAIANKTTVSTLYSGSTYYGAWWTNKDTGYLRNVTLSGDATIGGTQDYGMLWYSAARGGSYQAGTLTMNGHTLTYNTSATLYCWNMAYSGSGTIVVSGESNGTFQFSMGDTSAANCDFIVYGKISQNGNKFSPVKSLVFEPSGIYAGRAANQEDKQTIVAYEKYAPNLNYTGSYPTMKVTLGASGHTATTLDLGYFTNRTFNASTTTFYSGSTVTVDTGAREIAHGDKLVSWSSIPNATFTLATTVSDVEVVTHSDGLYVKSTLVPTYAVWNTAKEGDVKWDYYQADGTPFPYEWTDGVTADMQVHFSSLAEYAVLTNANLGITPAAYVLTGLSLSEGTDEIDLSGLGFVLAAGATIDLKGNTVKIPCSVMTTFNESTITNSTSQIGNLVLDVPSGTTVENTSVTLSGSLRFVKQGGGTFIPTKLYQFYTGGNEIAAGIVKLSTAHNQHDGYFNELGGATSATGGGYAEVDILPGATVDQNGQTGLRSYMFVLKGGTLTNTGTDMWTGAAMLFYFRLAEAERSYFTVPHNAGFYRDLDGATTLDLGGKTLQMGISGGKNFYLNNTTISNGTLDITSGGYLHTFRNASYVQNATINLNCALWLEKDLSVSNIVVKYNGDWDIGTAALNVYGEFRPENAGGYFYGPTMQDGSTLDFSAWPASLGWPVYSRSQYVYNKVKVRNTFSFANNATVKVKLGTKKVPRGTKVIDWSGSTPSNLNTLKFVRGDEGRQYSVVKRSDGLYIYSGFVIIVK